MTNFSKLATILPPEQKAIRAKCFHPTGAFVEFTKDETEQSIPERFEKIVRLHPQRLALKLGDEALSYEALNRAANQIAHAILAKGGKQDEPVALLLGKGVILTAAIFGVLKTGRIYVLLNPSFPSTRVDFILKNSGAGIIVTDSDRLSLATGFARRRLHLINVTEMDSRLPSSNPALSISPDTLTWITYTSGSTGEPKGVVQNHRNLLHLIMTQTNDLHICSQDRLAMLMSAAGDMFLALLNGAAIFPPNTKENRSDDLGNWLIQEKITIYSSVPSVFRNFVNTLGDHQTFPNVRLIRLTGEAVYRTDVETYRKHFPESCILVNRLSSTEVPTFRQYFIDHSITITDHIVPVGYAVEGNDVFLLRDDSEEASSNEVGEIAVKSRHLSPGYWRNPGLTQAKFSPVPAEEEKRIFKTGDLGRMSPDGCLVYLGRKDFQVKIRGHRVELAEIERALLDLGHFREVVVVSLNDHAGEQRLVAYLVPVRQTVVRADALRASLSEKLPDHMIPSSFVVLDSIPVTSTGKVDRNALPAPSRTRPELHTSFVAPRTFFEKELAQVWAEILTLNVVGIHDNFFDLGGHSLAATRVVSRVIKTFQVDVPLQALFAAPTVAEMAAMVTEHQAKKMGDQALSRVLAELESLSEDEAVNLLAAKKTI
jgi:amino acid adenylation domain-containing protein